MAEGALRELLVSWGVEVDEKPLEKLESHLESIKNGFEHVGERLAEYFAFREMKEFVLGTIEMGAHLQDMSERLGIGTQELQKFQFAAKLGGVDAEAASHSLGLFARQLGEAKEGGGEAAKTLAKLHIQYKDQHGAIRPVLDILDDFADRMQDTAPAERSAYAMRLFGRTGMAMIPVLKDGKEGLHKLYEEFDQLGGGLSDEFIGNAKKADDEIEKMKLGFVSLRGSLVQMMLPTLTIIVDKFMEWTKALVRISKETHVFQHIWDFAKIMAVVKAFQILLPVFEAIAAGEGLIDALNPFTWLVIGAVALFLILDDLWTMMEGGKSVIGDALGPEKSQFVRDLKDDFKVFSDAAHEILDFFSGDGTKSMDTFTLSVVTLGKALKYVADLMAAVVEGGKKIGEGIGGLLFHEAPKDKNGGLAEDGLTPEARAQLDALQGSGTSKYNISGGDKHADNMLKIMQQMVDVKNANASLPPGQAGALASMIPAYAPGGEQFQGPLATIGTLKVEVKHTGTEDPKSLAGNIATGTRDALNKQLVNANNSGKRK